MSKEVPRIAARWRVLVVNDDPMHLRHVQAIAANERMHIIPAGTAVDALHTARLWQIDGIVVHESAYEPAAATQLVRLFRHLPEGERRPILVVTRASRPGVMRDDGAPQLSWPLDVDDMRTLRMLMASAWSRANVLLLHDDPALARRLVPLLSLAGLSPREAEPRQALAALEGIRPDLLIVQPRGDDNGLDVVREVRSSPRWRHLPMLVVGGARRFTEALRAGANGVLELDGADGDVVEQVRAQLDRSRSAAENIDRDPLTAMLRPRAFLQRMSGMLEGGAQVALGLVALRLASPSAILQERALAAVAALLELERGDAPGILWCRWGPLEIAFAYPAAVRHEALAAVERATRTVEETVLTGRRPGSHGIALLSGIATTPEDATSLEGLLLAADRRLAAKDHAR